MKILILGSGGRLGAALAREFENKFEVVGFNHAQLDLAKPNRIREKLSSLEFDLLINCAAMTNVDLCETKREQAFAINAEAPKLLAEICTKKKAKLIHFSTDYVFDGEKPEPYVETDAANPISVYGESKLRGEENVLATVGDAVSVPTGKQTASPTIIRVSWVFGPDRPSFIDAMIKRAREEENIEAISDKWATPTYTHDIAEMLPSIFPWHRPPADVPKIIGKMPMPRILHFANSGECTWQEYAQHALDCCHKLGVPLKARSVGPLKLAEMENWAARRPVYSVLSSAKYQALTGNKPRSWRDAVAEYIERSYSKK